VADEIVKKNPDSALDIHINEHERLGYGMIEALRRNPEEIGGKLMHLAQGRAEKWFMDEVLRQIEELVKHKNALLHAAQKTSDELKLTERRLAAIDAGEIELGYSGKIRFKEAILNF
jgi:hypothetical protein